MSSYNIAIVGATGAVGEEILRVLDEMNFPVKDILPLASAKSAGEKVEFRGKEYVVRELTDSTFDENEIDIAFFSAGGSISAHYVPLAPSTKMRSTLRFLARAAPFRRIMCHLLRQAARW